MRIKFPSSVEFQGKKPIVLPKNLRGGGICEVLKGRRVRHTRSKYVSPIFISPFILTVLYHGTIQQVSRSIVEPRQYPVPRVCQSFMRKTNSE